ncbi:hypothetical protein ABZ897_35205 [Nonomuraea sp. NPDC046802]|uniref:hypothetical protein n=1 Tax=Nonomuraea sp. NPDC046802 TaxID=3154919 RepID=UPI0033F6BBFE
MGAHRPGESPLREPVAAVGVTLLALLFVYLIRRFLDRRPWSSLGWQNPSNNLLGCRHEQS